MNFMEAVKAMKEGKKVTTKTLNGFIVIRDYSSAFQIFPDGSEETKDFNLDDIETTNWYVDEDEDWNLYDSGTPYMNNKNFDIDDIKKCRDLIINDIKNTGFQGLHQEVSDIVNKRFGDLK